MSGGGAWGKRGEDEDFGFVPELLDTGYLADLNDNLNIFDLNSLTLEKYNRSLNYLRYIKMINDKYHFIENAQRYRESVLGWIGDWSGN